MGGGRRGGFSGVREWVSVRSGVTCCGAQGSRYAGVCHGRATLGLCHLTTTVRQPGIYFSGCRVVTMAPGSRSRVIQIDKLVKDLSDAAYPDKKVTLDVFSIGTENVM